MRIHGISHVPEVPAADLALTWWDRWLRSVLSNPAGWAFCREALRQAQAWHRWAQRHRRPCEVPRSACLAVLQRSPGAVREAPSELLLELLALPSGVEPQITAELLRRALGQGPPVPLPAAVRLANGHTAAKCTKGSLLFGALAAAAARQLTSTRQER